MSIQWTLRATSGVAKGNEQTLAQWGFQESKIERVLHGCDQMTFRSIAADALADMPVAFGDTATLYRTDTSTGTKVAWFQGVWTKPGIKISPDDESFSYVLSGPWWYLGRLPYQVPWQALTLQSGTAVTPEFLAQLNMGQAPDGTQLNLGEAITLLLQYVITACQAQAVPFTPFAIGDVVPAAIVPYQGVLNMTCEQYLIEIFRWLPDSQPNFDYSTVDKNAPGDGLGTPTFHVGIRSTLPAVSVPAKFAPNGGNSITPRYDLLVPAVFIKYQEENTVDGTPYVAVSLDSYPPGANENTMGAMVVTVNLQGGSSTYLKQPVKTHDRPRSIDDNDAMPWFQNMNQNVFGPNSKYDTGNIQLYAVYQAYDPKDPGTMRPPEGDINVLSQELVAGAITEWMNTDQDIYAAIILVTIKCIYRGSDPLTLGLFSDANSPGVWMKMYRMTATNAGTQTYTQLASNDPSEPPPAGLAQYLYNALSQLHYQGSIVITEGECSGLVGMGNTLNLSNGRAEWANMAAQVVRITEDIDKGNTTVQIGPPPRLNIDQLMDIYRVTRVRQPPYNANAQQTGNASSTDVKGHTYAAGTSEVTLPPLGVASTNWGLEFRQTPSGGWEMRINPKAFVGTSTSTVDQLYCAGVGVWGPIDPSWVYVFVMGNVGRDSTGNLVASNLTALEATNTFNIGADAWSPGAYVEDNGATPPTQKLFRRKIADIDWSTGSPVATPAIGGPMILKAQTISNANYSKVNAAIYPE